MPRVQLRSRVGASAFAAQPLPIREKMRAGVVRCEATAAQPVDRLTMDLVGDRPLTEERA